MKTTNTFVAGMAGIVLASSASAASLWNGSPFGGLSPFSSLASPFGFGSSPFSSFGSPLGFGASPFSSFGSPFGFGSSPFGMSPFGASPFSMVNPWSSGLPMFGNSFSPFGSGMSPYSAYSPLLNRGLGGLPYERMLSPYGSPYGVSPYSLYGAPPLANPYMPYAAVPAPGMLPVAPLPY